MLESSEVNKSRVKAAVDLGLHTAGGATFA
jgi:hypothetical protein